MKLRNQAQAAEARLKAMPEKKIGPAGKILVSHPLQPMKPYMTNREAQVLADAAWQFNEAVSLLREVRGSVMVPADVHAIDEALPAMQLALEAFVQVLEPRETP